MDIHILQAIDDKFDAVALKIERRVTATISRKLARVHLLVAADNEDNPDNAARIKAALDALGQ